MPVAIPTRSQPVFRQGGSLVTGEKWRTHFSAEPAKPEHDNKGPGTEEARSILIGNTAGYCDAETEEAGQAPPGTEQAQIISPGVSAGSGRPTYDDR